MRNLSYAIVAVMGGLLAFSARAVESVGTVPAPALTAVEATASSTYDKANQLYVYKYTVKNGAASTGTLDTINIDISNSQGRSPSSAGEAFKV